MSRHHLFIAATCLLLLFYYTAVLAYADGEYVRRVTLFEGRTKQSVGEGNKSSREFISFVAPTLGNVNGSIVAITEAHFQENNKSFVGIALGLLVCNGNKSGEINAVGVNDSEDLVRRLVTVLFGAYGNTGGNVEELLSGNSQITDLMTERVVDQKHNSTYDLFRLKSDMHLVNISVSEIYRKYLLANLNERSLKRLVSVGIGIQMEDGTFVLPVQAMGNDERMVSLILKYDRSAGVWSFSRGSSASGCTNPSVLEWEKGRLFIITSCDAGHRKVYESFDKGDTWTENVGTLSRVWGNSRSRSAGGSQGGFITAEINGKKVMLYAHSLFLQDGTPGQLRLWMTDNTRILNVTLISSKEEKVTASSLLYKDDRLYCLYETHNKGQKVVLAELPGALGRIKHVLKVWDKLDKSLSEHCSAYETSYSATDSKCTPSIPTTGLVGLLANSSNETAWYDEYRCVGATLKGATKIPNGFIFRGVGAGAQWPVSNQGQSQRYYFANNSFTLAATVAIHTAPTGITALLGVSLSDYGSKMLLALSVDWDRCWFPIYGNSGLEPIGPWELNKEYQVVFKYDAGNGTIYLDGVLMQGSKKVSNRFFGDIKYIFLGGYGTGNLFTGMEASVANVLLYNRPLNDTEIKALLQFKAPIPALSAPKSAFEAQPRRRTSSFHSDGVCFVPRVLLPQSPADMAAPLVNDETMTSDADHLDSTNEVVEPLLDGGSGDELEGTAPASKKDALADVPFPREDASSLPDVSAIHTKDTGAEAKVLSKVETKMTDSEVKRNVDEKANTLGTVDALGKDNTLLRGQLDSLMGSIITNGDSGVTERVSYAVFLLLAFCGIAIFC